MRDAAIYVHIPFCDHKCIYCDFYSIINYDNKSSYLPALKKEISFYSAQFGNQLNIVSVFFGGGTPSFMEPEYIDEIIGCISSSFSLSENCEITLETNPGTVDPLKIKAFRECGINRISIGVQSFNKDELEFLTRIHDKETAINTVYTARENGFDNISIDLIFNLPGQTKEKWLRNLQTAVQLPVTHISAYSLILERGTILNKMVIDGKVELQGEDYDAELYSLTIDFMNDHGFSQYEVSNFCKPGYECVHNKVYWQHKDYLGFGTSAHSFIQGKRWHNYSSLHRYITEVNTTGTAEAGSEILSQEQMLEEFVMLGLRSNGIDLRKLHERFGDKWLNSNRDYLKLLKQNKYISADDDHIRLTPHGYAVCDEILAKLI